MGVVFEGQNNTYCYGSLDRDGPTSPDERTLFEIGSITKVFTTSLLADMHLKGEIDLDDPVNKFLPSPVALRSLGGVDVTLRHLATHTSGLPRIPSNLGLKNIFLAKNPYAEYTVESLYAYLSKCHLMSSPGSAYYYSNLGMGLLGHVLGLVAVMDYEALVRERICRPLGMNDTAISLSDDQRDRLAPGQTKRKQVSNWDMPTLAGCAAFCSTIHDMLTFLNANIHPRSTPLKDAIELAHTIQLRKKKPLWPAVAGTVVAGTVLFVLGMASVFMIVDHAPKVMFMTTIIGTLGMVLAIMPITRLIIRRIYSLIPVTQTGLGWLFESLADGNDHILWHDGVNAGYRSYIGFSKERGFGVVLLSNSTVPIDPTGRRLLKILAKLTS